MNEYQQALHRIIELEDRNTELLEALDRIAGYTNAWPDGLSAGDAYDMQAIARQAFRKVKGD